VVTASSKRANCIEARDVSRVKRILGITGWIFLGSVLGGVVVHVMGLDEKESGETPVEVTATPVDRNDAGELVPKGMVKNYGMAIRSGPGAAYEIVGNAPMESEYRIVGRNQAGDWWKIVFADIEGKEAHGWLYAPFEKAVNAGGVEVVEAPPTPTLEVPSTIAPEPTLNPAPTMTPGAG